MIFKKSKIRDQVFKSRFFFGRLAFTLPEVLIAVGIFSVLAVIIGSLYIEAYRVTGRANMQNQIYEDARFVLARIADEVRNGMVDYDEYYNQRVVVPTVKGGGGGALYPRANGWLTYGQNYGRYYSAFFNPGNDNALGFDCNDAPLGTAVGLNGRDQKRNIAGCTPLRKSLDKNTGSNPFTGKVDSGKPEDEDAFCGAVSYLSIGGASPTRYGCNASGEPDTVAERSQDELYLISANGGLKTILGREIIGGTDAAPIYSLSMLKLKGVDINGDGMVEKFVCADGFQCRGGVFDVDVIPAGSNPELNLTANDPSCFPALPSTTGPADLPRGTSTELGADTTACDVKASGYSKDFVPISPFRINIKDLKFYISPLENPVYAFGETAEQIQPRVTIVMTVAANPETTIMTERFDPITLAMTVSSRVLDPVPAPLLTYP